MNPPVVSSPWIRVFLTILLGLLLTHAVGLNAHARPASRGGATWSRTTPVYGAPQFVSVTFDDNFGLAAPGAVGGVRAVVAFFAGKRNPEGLGDAVDLDGAPIRTTFFGTSIYMVDASKRVLGGYKGEDWKGHNRSAWKAGIVAGHEMADHTVNHFNGGTVPAGKEDCCRARDWDIAHWIAEIASCRTLLTDPHFGLGAKDVIGFRAPYLSYNDAMFSSLQKLGFVYDSSLPNCFADDEDGTNCSWPYLLDHGSPDAETLAHKLRESNTRHPILLPLVGNHRGLWELPITTLIIPPDAVASKYYFKTGLRDRIKSHAASLFYEPSSGKITGVDYTLLIEAGVTGDEMRAILEYNLDLHLSGNRSPLVFVAHSHLYAFSTPEDNPDTPSDAERKARWKGLTEFIAYALTKPEVRVVAGRDIIEWMSAITSRKS
jgi:peptidoglycan/xylan/chitin deacetylase (PgdA/CDA1 family)